MKIAYLTFYNDTLESQKHWKTRHCLPIFGVLAQDGKTRRVFPENSARFSKNSARFSKNSARFSKNSARFSKNSACFSIPICHNVIFRSASKVLNEVARSFKRTSFVLLFLAQGIGVPPQGVLERSGRMKRKRKHGKPGFARNAGEMRPA